MSLNVDAYYFVIWHASINLNRNEMMERKLYHVLCSYSANGQKNDLWKICDAYYTHIYEKLIFLLSEIAVGCWTNLWDRYYFYLPR